MHLNPHEKPPSCLKAVFKFYQKISAEALDCDAEVVDFVRGLTSKQKEVFSKIPWTSQEGFHAALRKFNEECHGRTERAQSSSDKLGPPEAYVHTAFQGLVILPSLLPSGTQETLLARLLLRDLSDPRHKTNVHFHHDIEYPSPGQSFFNYDPCSTSHIVPKDAKTHTRMLVSQFMNKRLRWITLGGQYDWTKKEYPSEEPPAFPRDLRCFLNSLFPETKSEAAIVNLYSPGDVLSLHRDVAEHCDHGLISVSIGCDGIFVLALQGEHSESVRHLVVRLRSGDVVYMADRSRYAWHGIPLVIPYTCPEHLRTWPATREPQDGTDELTPWNGWLSTKRINLNVRQMFD